ncbi:MAG: peptidoglycan-binding protein [Rhodospirillales bacterium]|nr:peptidoglycan-binding protein [Rhodospirillales bacterium]
MPRFAVIAVPLLVALLAAGAAAAWRSGWFTNFANVEAAGGPADPAPAGAGEAVEGAATAIHDHDLAAVRRYLATGGDPNATDAEGEILLNKAVLHGSPEIMEALLAAGADPDQPGRNGLSPLTIAALAGRQAMLERLMQANATEPAARVAGAAPTTGSGRGSASSSGASDVTSPVLASLAGDGEPQTPLPAEPYASMTGLAINPIARPAPGSPPAALPAALPAASPAALPAGGAAAAPQSPQGGAAPFGSTASDAATAGGAPTPWVTAAQKRLGQLGYYKGPITGFAGSLTADAVKRYQAVAGLPQDGIVTADLLRRIGATVEAPGAPASAPAAAAPPATAAPAGGAEAEQARAAGQNQGPGLQQVRNALGQEFNSATRADALRQHCQANTNAWVHDEAVGRSLFCRDVLGAPPR